MEDKKISEAIRLLYKGAKMLPYHCPDCGVPIFKYQDKMICPSCGREAVFESEMREDVKAEGVAEREREFKPIQIAEKSEPSTSEKPESGKSEIKSNIEFELDGEPGEPDKKLKKALEVKLVDISELLIKATSPDEIERLLNLIERVLSILKNLGGN